MEPHALDDFATLLGRAGDDASAVRQYLTRYAIPEDWPGELSRMIGPAARASMESAIEAVRKATDILYVSAEGMRHAANYYRQTDATAAAQMDATLPGREPGPATAQEGRWAATGITPTFTDVHEPQGRLTPVDDVEYTHWLADLDLISPAHHIIAVWEQISGTNPLNDALDFIVGDWQSIANAGRSLENAANALEDLALNLQGGASALHPAWWQGHAGETAYQFFARTAQAVVDLLVMPMRELAARFAEISMGVYHYSEATSGFIKGMIDGAVVVALAAAGGAASAATVVGPVFAAGVVAIEVARILALISSATQALTTLYGVGQQVLGVIRSSAADLDGAALPAPSGGGYAHPLAG
ncbi:MULTISPECIES: hypothetical protein [Catenuloplanes]|uniref:WXG100 family type VII secretion target n=1 Tax=Catenuloplanes niger TaxID=587534 RepID=A0AAE3ZYF8_9ACTN|nr:hypothetical protein [Catenuloplanes niger]MDR7327242.1 hypothetical protein [Catenuloplanes niger]